MNAKVLIILLSGLARPWSLILPMVIFGTLGYIVDYPNIGFFFGMAVGFTITYTRGVLGK